jgi:hypothetical protein
MLLQCCDTLGPAEALCRLTQDTSAWGPCSLHGQDTVNVGLAPFVESVASPCSCISRALSPRGLRHRHGAPQCFTVSSVVLWSKPKNIIWSTLRRATVVNAVCCQTSSSKYCRPSHRSVILGFPYDFWHEEYVLVDVRFMTIEVQVDEANVSVSDLHGE